MNQGPEESSPTGKINNLLVLLFKTLALFLNLKESIYLEQRLCKTGISNLLNSKYAKQTDTNDW